MLIKFFARGKGSGAAPVDYVCHTAGRENAPPEVLRGDADLTKNLIDSIDRDWRYTSGVVSFALEDAPTPEQQERVMDAFEKAAFAGLEQDQYNILWVRHQHTEGGRVELHFVTPRMELTTGKALNIAPPNWQKLFDPLQNALNYENRWADPHSPEHARNTQKATENAPRARDRESIGKYVETLVEASLVSNRAEIIKALQDAGLEINRQGKDYISVKDPKTPEQKAFRLKGAIYGEDWTTEQLSRTASKEAGSREAAGRGIGNERNELARNELAKGIRERADYNAARYKRPVGGLNVELRNRLEADHLDSDRLHVHDVIRVGDLLDDEQFQNGKDQHLEPTNRTEAKEPGRSERWGLGDNQVGRRELSGFPEPRKREESLGEDLSLRPKSVFENNGKQIDDGQDNATRARIAEIRRKFNEWYEKGYQFIASWFDEIRRRRAFQYQLSTEGSRESNDEYRKNLDAGLGRIGRSLGELSATDETIERAAEKVRLVAEIRKKDRQRNRDENDDLDDFGPEF